MTYKTMTIKQAIDDIDQSKLYLPALQRKFVWRKHQIELLFESLMRNYPIGTFLFWRLNKKRADEYVFYEFLKEYDERNPFNRRKTGSFTQPEILGVLDGQQRLSSLYIGLMGTHAERARYQRASNAAAYEKMCLHLNLLSLPYTINYKGHIETQEERNFEFRFLSPVEAERNDVRRVKSEGDELQPTERTEPVLWLKVGEVLKWDEEPDLDQFVEELFDSKQSGPQREAIRDNKRSIKRGLETLHKRIWGDDILNYFEIQKDDLEDILKIFVRVNSGGTILGKTDLLFSTIVATWDDGREEIENLLKEINAKGDTFNFTNEYLMRCCLVLTDAPVVYKVNSFKTENVKRIQTEWHNIAKAVRETVGLLAEFGFNGSLLTSQTATIIIAYHIYKGGDLDNASKKDLRKYLIHALLTRVFGSSQDQLLAALRNSLREEVTTEAGAKTYRLRQRTFCFEDVLAARLPSRRSLAVSEKEIDLFLERRKGPDAFAVLVLLYPHLRFQNQFFHQDHIHPFSQFNPEVFARLGLTQGDQAYWVEHRDSVPNLQLMEGKENVKKNAAPLVDWMARMPEPERATFRKDNYFPEGVGLEFAQFREFYSQRKAILFEKLEKELAIDSAEEVLRAVDVGALEEMTDEEAKALEDSIA
ncbi:MAG TPA: DUF262 domain-containing protein [Steroidobacteraceae bacterium]|jgi:hypothetical protein|nr:DUF262 domain-containing protein [Steroidobacteraceae bacterium]